MNRGAVAEIDLGAIRRNLAVVRKITGNLPVIAVVKADAYGHGAKEVSRLLEKEGASVLATAYVSEAVELREAGIKMPILVLFNAPGGFSGSRGTKEFFQHNLMPVVSDIKTAQLLSIEARKQSRTLDIHIKLDTGMGRMGFNGEKALPKMLKAAGLANLRVVGLMSHFSEADLADMSYAKIQLERFKAVRDALKKKIKGRILCHMANSAAIVAFRQSHLDGVRPGLMLYGGSMTPILKGSMTPILKGSLTPAMKVKTRILSLRRLKRGQPVSYGRTFITARDTLVAVLPVGYADGYFRAYSNNADVIVRGVRAPVIGRVCMDLTMIDVTDIRGVKEGDDAVLLGEGGKESIGAWELAERASTIPYEVLTSLGRGSKKVYSG